MKTASTIRIASLLALAFPLTSYPRSCNAQVTVIGPGPVATPLENYGGGHYRVVAGTELVADETHLSSDGKTLRGGNAIFTTGESWVFDGGLVEGAAVTTQAGVEAASGGTAIELYSPSTQRFVFNDGVFRGGAVVIDAPPPENAHFAAGAAMRAGYQNSLRITIHGGLFEGGTVSLASTPGMIMSRAPALNLGNEYFGQFDVYGGTFIGGIHINGVSILTMHGNSLEIQPSYDGIIPRGVSDFTISGNYLNGDPFSHSVHIRPADLAQIIRGTDFLTLSQHVPEPSGILLSIAGCMFGAVRRPR